MHGTTSHRGVHEYIRSDGRAKAKVCAEIKSEYARLRLAVPESP
jgi:hypothetical protein